MPTATQPSHRARVPALGWPTQAHTHDHLHPVTMINRQGLHWAPRPEVTDRKGSQRVQFHRKVGPAFAELKTGVMSPGDKCGARGGDITGNRASFRQKQKSAQFLRNSHQKQGLKIGHDLDLEVSRHLRLPGAPLTNYPFTGPLNKAVEFS